jgi:hypothetical protein
MNAIADALVYAVTFINCRGDEDDDDDDDDSLDDDVGALESIAGCLQNITPAEQDALAAAADRALAAEKTLKRPRKKFLHDYAHWMEEMFVDGWEGNRRVPE